MASIYKNIQSDAWLREPKAGTRAIVIYIIYIYIIFIHIYIYVFLLGDCKKRHVVCLRACVCVLAGRGCGNRGGLEHQALVCMFLVLCQAYMSPIGCPFLVVLAFERRL